MGRYLLRRVGQALLVLWAAYTVSFVVLYLLPGDPVQIMLSGGQPGGIVTATPEQVQALRHEYGFDRSLVVQYLTALWHAMQGDLGRSLQTQQDVVRSIGEALPPTLQLAACALVLAVVLGVAFATLVALTRSRRVRELLLALPPIGTSLPSFWVGLLLIQLVSFQLGWLPALGDQGFESLVLPSITLALPSAAVIAQVLSKSLLTTMEQPFVEVVEAKGAGAARVHFRHALRNASLPTLTLVGIWTGALVSGSVIVEVVFSRPGIGQLTAQSVDTKDIPMIQGIVVLAAVVYVAVNLVVDLLYSLLDPRIGQARRQGAPA